MSDRDRLEAVRAALGPELLRAVERTHVEERFIVERLLGARVPFSVSQAALECFGMPNKHERERMREVIEALARAGLLISVDADGERWEPARPPA